MTERLASLSDFASALSTGGYAVKVSELAGREAVLAETPYALVGIVEVGDAREAVECVSDVQAVLTRLAAEVPSARRWDLYLLIHVLSAPTFPADASALEILESDTRYVRKFVRIRIASSLSAIDTALRPLLPMRPAATFDLADPLEALRRELLDLDVAPTLADDALETFATSGEVRVP